MRRRAWIGTLGGLVMGLGAAAACTSSHAPPTATGPAPTDSAAPSASAEAGPPPSALATLEADTGVSWIVSIDERLRTPYFVAPVGDPGISLSDTAKPEDVAMAFFARYGGVFHITDAASELQLERSGGPTHMGMRFANFVQVEGGVPVLGSRLSVQFDAAGRMCFISGRFLPDLHGSSASPVLDGDAAISAARASIAADALAAMVAEELPVQPPALTLDARGTAPTFAYLVSLEHALPETFVDGSNGSVAAPARWGRRVSVDARTGAILQTDDLAKNQYAGAGAPALGSGQGVLLDTKSFSVTASSPPSGGPFYLQEARPGETSRFVRTASVAAIRSTSATSWDPSATDPGSAVDAYSYFDSINSWWRARGRDSFDGTGGAIAITVHDTSYPFAAWWYPTNGFHVGPPTWSKTQGVMLKTASAALDAMGHEFQHAVNASSLTLADTPVSDTIDESLGDVFGQFIERAYPAPDGIPRDLTVLGEALAPHGLRDLVDPHTTFQPDHVNDTMFPPSATDAHKNTGIPNRAWSLTTFGGEDQTSGISVPDSLALGLDDSEALYLSLIESGGIDGLGSMQQLARALVGITSGKYGSDPDGPMAAVACAWYAVGVLTKSDLQEWNIDVCVDDKDAGPPGTGDASPLCLLLSSADVAAAVGVASLPAPSVQAGKILVRCQYFDSPPRDVPELALLIDLDTVAVPLAFSVLRDQFGKDGFHVVDQPGLGLEAFSAVSDAVETDAGAILSTSVVVRTDTVMFQLASRAPLDKELGLAALLLSRM